ncbi:nucleotidyltransferase domain-containing protein [Venatoribacter cucullus]|uniref:nucleotidyltransferase domain-containing protein n=1 Tax=Venatoribacter cucullus TaxID=2661630 RepID=UPI00223F4D55|nr:nucleotidyltransferase domain-containing protein [Venatoribacter cucullus]UZK04729.1 hypothetical protein GAY96_12825 [Venatoribacter cucullus]
MNWGLSEREIALLRAALAAHPNVQRAVLYGSRAMGNYRTGSDIDLTLEGDLHLQDINGVEPSAICAENSTEE